MKRTSTTVSYSKAKKAKAPYKKPVRHQTVWSLVPKPAKSAELKFFDTALSFNFDVTGEVPATGQLSLIPQGVTENNRIGRKCVIKSIQIRATVTYVPGATTTGSANGFVYVVLDKQANGAAAAVTDVLTSSAMSTAFINLDNSKRFVILKRFPMSFVSQAGVSAAYARDTKILDWYHKCNMSIEYDSTAATGAIGTIRSNNIFLLAGADGQGDDEIAFSGNCRLRFLDS